MYTAGQGEVVGAVAPVSAPTSTRVEVMGPTEEVAFPNLCIRCGEMPQGTVDLYKIFFRAEYEGPSRHVLSRVRVPVCSACRAQHLQEQSAIPGAIRNRLYGQWALKALPYIFPLGVCLWFVRELTPKFLRELAEKGWQPAHFAGTAIWMAIVGFFALMALMFARMIINGGEFLLHEGEPGTSDQYCLVEHGPLWSLFIVPVVPTGVQRAMQFTDDRSEIFDGERHNYWFQNPIIGQQFAALNASRRWNPRAPRARRAANARWVLIAVVLVIGILGMIFGKGH